MASVTVDTGAIASSLNNIRSGCATDQGRSAVDAVSISLGHQFSRTASDDAFNMSAFLRDCGVRS